MRILIWVLLALAPAVTSAAWAQSAGPTEVLSGRAGATSCRDFLAMSTAQRSHLLARMTADAPQRSIADTPNFPPDNQSSNAHFGSGALVPGVPLTTGDLVAACQAAPASASLSDAYSQFNSGSNLVQTGQ